MRNVSSEIETQLKQSRYRQFDVVGTLQELVQAVGWHNG